MFLFSVGKEVLETKTWAGSLFRCGKRWSLIDLLISLISGTEVGIDDPTEELCYPRLIFVVSALEP